MYSQLRRVFWVLYTLKGRPGPPVNQPLTKSKAVKRKSVKLFFQKMYQRTKVLLNERSMTVCPRSWQDLSFVSHFRKLQQLTVCHLLVLWHRPAGSLRNCGPQARQLHLCTSSGLTIARLWRRGPYMCRWKWAANRRSREWIGASVEEFASGCDLVVRKQWGNPIAPIWYDLGTMGPLPSLRHCRLDVCSIDTRYPHS